ncbi:iron complex transport system substrate-binding protein [Paenibacillus endophyticus]|uniref:Iron complex transport system substrate-binding protein n=1 Tax=Paenibacillus endophyticus TaxID=1294268 RepID=A0A7W5CAY3_9BACL|nr:iron-siderophore ABC transporter substrate-binding protein [Paenibacillus endophyticus]MBB3153930.1 iron complex transport system substrate-binding protein [Paenibacillus endophyticus]
MSKRRIGSVWMIALVLIVMTACGANETNEGKNTAAPAAEPETEKQRVVATSITYPDFLYVLGVTPVAAENYHSEFPSYFNDAFKDVVKLGDGENLEGLLAAEPDLIIAPKWRDEKVYDQYSKIAKTVLMPDRDNWRDELRDVAAALDKTEIAEKVIKDYEAHIQEAKAALQPTVGSETFVYMRIMQTESYIMGEISDRGKVIHGELGLQTVAAYPKEEGSLAISLETLTEYDPDHIILQVDGGEDKASAQKIYDDMKINPVWQSLKAVKANQVYLVGDKEWMNFGFSPVATIRAVDEIVAAIKQNKQ